MIPFIDIPTSLAKPCIGPILTSIDDFFRDEYRIET
jgi:hypothetical protein